MGIKGLNKLFKNYLVKRHISQFKNTTIGIDGLSWAYKGFYSFLYDNMDSMNKIIKFYSKMLRVLQKYKIKPVIVLDGKILKSKEKTKAIRAIDRINDKNLYIDKMNNGDKYEGIKYKNKSEKLEEIYITKLIQFLKKLDIEVIVAPYESDSQLVYLEKIKYIDYIVTEDSDLVLLGGKNILFKMSIYGEIDYYSKDNIKNKIDSYDIFDEQYKINFHIKKFLEFNDHKRIFSGILSGCDYEEHIKNLGIKTSIELVNRLNSFQNILKTLFTFSRIKEYITEDFILNIGFCLLTFSYQIVYCPNIKKIRRFNDINEKKLTEEELKLINFYAGEYFKDYKNLINGKLSPSTLKDRILGNDEEIEKYINIYEKTKMNKTFRNLLNYGKSCISLYTQDTDESESNTEISDNCSKDGDDAKSPILINNLTLEINYEDLNVYNQEVENQYHTIEKIEEKKITNIKLKKKKIAKFSSKLIDKVNKNIEILYRIIN